MNCSFIDILLVANAGSAIATMNYNLTCISVWAKSFGFQINPTESQASITDNSLVCAADVTSSV